MRIADGLELLKSMGREKTRLEQLAAKDAWAYMSKDPNAKWEPTFNLEKNHEMVVSLDKKMRKLSRAINFANNTVEIPGIDNKDYEEWL